MFKYQEIQVTTDKFNQEIASYFQIKFGEDACNSQRVRYCKRLLWIDSVK
jgi:hypothetical protein